MRFVSIPGISAIIYPKAIKSFPLAKGKLFLSFDDGPEPSVTPRILDILKDFNAKATFFCLGEKVAHHIELFNQIISEGHSIGNHGYYHLNGFKVSSKNYIENVEQANSLIHSILFRPPYGKMKLGQYYSLQQHYKVILWNVMSYDFDEKLSGADCAKIVVKYTTPGSIIVFHDNVKAGPRVIKALPMVLDYFIKSGFCFEGIPVF